MQLLRVIGVQLWAVVIVILLIVSFVHMLMRTLNVGLAACSRMWVA